MATISDTSTFDPHSALAAPRVLDPRIIVLAALGLLLSGYNNFIISLALIEIKPLFHLTAAQSGLVAAATLVGMLVGALTLGRLADVVGRRTALLVDLTLVAVFAALSAFVTGAPLLIVLRFLAGTGIGAGYPIGASFVADVSPDHSRGRFMTLAFAGWGIGAFVAALVGWLLIKGAPFTTGWRFMLASGAVPALVAFAIIVAIKLPESPRWQQAQALEKLPFSRVFAPGILPLTLAALIPWWLMDIAVYGIGLFTPTILTGLGFQHPVDVALGTLILQVFTLVGVLFAGLLIDKVGRRPLQIVGFLGMGAALIVLAFIGARPAAFVLLAIFAGFQIAENAGPNTTTWIVPAELFPTRLRASGQGLATAFSRTGAILGVLLLPILVASISLRATLIMVGIVSLLGAITTARLLPETKGKPLSD